MSKKITVKEMKTLIVKKLSHNFGVSPREADKEHFYKALALVIGEILTTRHHKFESRAEEQKKKQVYYLCMEFLVGRSLKNALFNLGLEEVAHEAMESLEMNLDELYELEPDAGLGNGGLGRLAACFLDALASCSYYSMGYCLRYEYGIFNQKLIDGWQTELPDFWLPGGEVWLQARPEKSVEVLINGEIKETWENGRCNVAIVDATKVIAVPYDLMIPGIDGKGYSRIRVWASESAEFDMNSFNQGNYMSAMQKESMAELITKVLYPEDNHPEGKSLRLYQQYFLVSATMQDILRRHIYENKMLDNLPEMVAIHLNDTHPVLAVPELMRLLMDKFGYGWDRAWNIVTKTFAYTNHTVMSEALECWEEDRMKRCLPRIYQILKEINRRFCEGLRQDGVSEEKISHMSIIGDGRVRMANLAVMASYSVNGVSRLHSEILKKDVFNDFYKVFPDKFTNVTNGITYRRWLNQANPELAHFIKELIGEEFKYDASKLSELMKFVDDKGVLDRLQSIKHRNKVRLSEYVRNTSGILIDPNSIFDIQVKRLHEYKRQHMNALNILATYLWLKENPNAYFTPKTYIFAAKAAAGYYFAKQIIKFIVKLSELINNDPDVNKKLKVVFLENYNVSLAEKLMPSAEISEQISLAGTEASGTGNMKFMINGAITLGTLDGANIEICDAVGRDNMIIFGLNSDEVNNLKNSGYSPMIYYNNNYILKRAIDEMSNGILDTKFDDIARALMDFDQYMVLADFSDYQKAQKKASDIYGDRYAWNKMSLINIANAGRFSGDRAIEEYVNNIWHLGKVDIDKDEARE